MKLNAPTRIVFLISIIIAIIALLALFHILPIMPIQPFWLMVAAYIVLVLSVLLPGL